MSKRLPPIQFAIVFIALMLAVLPLSARDLHAAGDGEHLWLVVEAPGAGGDGEDADTPRRLVYHASTDREAGQANELDPVDGAMMPRGIAAGDGRLLLIGEDRQVQTLRPVWSKLLLGYVYETRSLPSLPKGCALMSLAIGSHGPWALVRVEDAELLADLDQIEAEKATAMPEGRQRYNRALGLPPGYDWGKGKHDKKNRDKKKQDEPRASGPAEEASADDAGVPDDSVTEAGPESASAPASELPAYRLIHLFGGKWVSAPLPSAFPAPRHAVLLMRGDANGPTIVVEPQNSAAERNTLLRFTPIAGTAQKAQAATEAGQEVEPIAWALNTIDPRPWPGRLWTALLVDQQAVLAVECERSAQHIRLDSYLMRGDQAIRLGDLYTTARKRPRWAAVNWAGKPTLITYPGPKPVNADGSEGDTLAIAGFAAIGLDGQVVADPETGFTVMPLIANDPSPVRGNADLYIQIGTFVAAMLLMMAFYRRAPRAEQIDLPKHLVLAGFGRRIIAGLIDLAPGFWLAGTLYGTTINETMLYWPGNGIEKVLPAMRPGFVVIAVTLVHTTLGEVLTARSLGKWLTGIYVADLSGKPASPVPSLIRAISRTFDLFAPLMLVVALISPARQRLGDILARTTLVMHKPPMIEDNPDDDNP